MQATLPKMDFEGGKAYSDVGPGTGILRSGMASGPKKARNGLFNSPVEIATPTCSARSADQGALKAISAHNFGLAYDNRMTERHPECFWLFLRQTPEQTYD